ncbi:hypothetical protein NDU88_004026 [Pleurodeles waltl]|uniref:Uncharacterized protein n=1 Tax=Pleurodeles waltl TaxID=8319 RepID=A0AAV7T7D7_PLEWA|nr:hypothetical protein NDU88_004026 [Pleurodeles waltl]
MDIIATDLGILKDDHKKLADKVRAAEGTLAELAPQHTWNTDTITDLQCRIQQLHNHAEDAEGSACRNNMRIVGTPEVVERAHSVPPRRPLPLAPPHLRMAGILNYRDRNHLLRMAQKASPIKINNAVVFLFPDYTLEVRRHHASYQAGKKQLHEEGLKYAHLFPERFKILHDDRSLFFRLQRQHGTGLSVNILWLVSRRETGEHGPDSAGNLDSTSTNPKMRQQLPLREALDGRPWMVGRQHCSL